MTGWFIVFLLTLGALIILDGIRQSRQMVLAPQLNTDDASSYLEPEPTPAPERPTHSAPAASPEQIMAAMSEIADAASEGLVPNPSESLADANKPQFDAIRPLHQALSAACVAALEKQCMTLRLVDATLTWGDLQEALMGERLVYDCERSIYHAADDAGDPAFSVASAVADSALLAPREGNEEAEVSGLMLLLPAATPAAKIINFERMVAFAYRLKSIGAGRLVDTLGNPATRNMLEFWHEEMLQDLRKALLEERKLARG